MSARFEGRTVLVTGASRGLGRTIALAFGAEGAFVGAACRTARALAEQTVDDIRKAGGDGVPLCFDIRDADAIQQAIRGLVETRGSIDVLVNNAGIVGDAWFAMADPATLAEILEVNLSGAFQVTRAVTRGMIAAGSGVVVNIASVAGMVGTPGQSMYGASKGGLLALTRTLGTELAPRGIRVNAVVPGLIDAGMTHRMDQRRLQGVLDSVPLARMGSAEEVANAVLFLASDDASYIVGQALVVDGGLTR